MKAPLSYQGGKTRLADKIVSILSNKEYDYFFDICCGSGSISIELVNRGITSNNIYMIDGGPIGAFWESIANKTFSIDEFKRHIDMIPSDKSLIRGYLNQLAKIEFNSVKDVVYEYLILQAGAFGGKQIWDKDGKFANISFRSYWQPRPETSRQSPVNPMMPMPNTLFQNVSNVLVAMNGVNACYSNVEAFDFKKECTNKGRVCFYIDPPYINTTRYGINFDIMTLVNRLINLGDVYVSEYEKLSDSFVEFEKTNKGGISGKQSSYRRELLNIFEQK